jgi:hypothetical protein
MAMKKLLLISIAALFLATGAAHAQTVSEAVKNFMLPPVEYDKPFGGKLEEVVVKSREEMDASCKHIGLLLPNVPLGCGKLLAADHCVIYLARDEVNRSVGLTTDLVRRHEVGHCNGWPKEHPGGRHFTSHDY